MWLVYALLAALVWGLDYSLNEHIMKNKISPLTLITLQMLIGGTLFLCFALRSTFRSEVMMLISHRKMLYFLLATITTFSLGNFLVFLSMQAKNATLAGLIELCYPLFIAFFAWVLFSENQLTLSVIIGGILISSGVIVIYLFA